MPSLTGQQARFLDSAAEFEAFSNIRYRCGRNHVDADFCSQLPCEDGTEVSSKRCCRPATIRACGIVYMETCAGTCMPDSSEKLYAAAASSREVGHAAVAGKPKVQLVHSSLLQTNQRLSERVLMHSGRSISLSGQ
jgi:hypothetical protein